MFNQNCNGYSLADIAAATGNNNDGFGFGGNSGWWIILLFLIFGWGGRGYGYGGYSETGGGAQTNYVLTTDFATIERKLDGVNNGLCDGFYTQAQLINSLNNTVTTSGYNTLTAIQSNAIAQMQDTNAIQAQLAQCCCDNRAATADLKYTMATDTCALNNNLSTAIRNVIDNDNANYRAIDARLTAMEMAAKDDKIAEMSQKINALQLAASQQAQNTYLIDQLRPCPSPAYVVPNPYAYTSTCNCGCNC